MGLGTYFHKIVGIDEVDSENELDFVLIDVDITKYDRRKYRIEHLGHKGYLMDTANALAALKGIKAIESVYEPVYGSKITDAEKEAHIKKLEGGFMEEAREEFWENQPEEIRTYYERLADQEIERQVRQELGLNKKGRRDKSERRGGKKQKEVATEAKTESEK